MMILIEYFICQKNEHTLLLFGYLFYLQKFAFSLSTIDKWHIVYLSIYTIADISTTFRSRNY